MIRGRADGTKLRPHNALATKKNNNTPTLIGKHFLFSPPRPANPLEPAPPAGKIFLSPPKTKVPPTS